MSSRVTKPAAGAVTRVIPVIPPTVQAEPASPSTPRHGLKSAAAQLGVSLRSLQRYLAQFRPRHILNVATGERGETLLSDEDLGFLQAEIAKGPERARNHGANYQVERIAQLCAGVPGGRTEAERIRRELRALADSDNLPTTARRVTALMERVPHLRQATPHLRLVWYYATFHSTDLAAHADQGAPPYTTVERAFRRAVR